MADSPRAVPALILPVGTQVVVRVDVKGAGGETRHPRGAVGVVVRSPSAPPPAPSSTTSSSGSGSRRCAWLDCLILMARFVQEDIAWGLGGRD